MKSLITFLLMVNVFGFFARANTPSKEISIVPKPQQLMVLEGHFRLDRSVHIFCVDETLKPESDYLAAAIGEVISIKPVIAETRTPGKAIVLRLDPVIQSEEGYQINSSEDSYEISAKTSAGVFYGIQTFLQLLPVISATVIELPLVSVVDEPRFEWRGMHLDVCRHFYSVEVIKKLIDQLCRHKMNTFHWHLTEDQGWRIEIKKYPKLTEVGAWRNESKIGHMADYPHRFDGQKYGGYYTQEQVKEVVAYAQQRHVTIVPEIEMPGHAQAATAAYPELGCFNDTVSVWTLWGVSENVFCAGKESTFKFLEDVLSEVVELFPETYIHVGGDECPKAHWKTCPLCQQRIQDEGLKDENELQSYFIQRMEHFLSSKGKKLIGWDEILEGGLAEGAAVMSWRGEQGGIEAAELGHKVVMTPGNWCYFDNYQSADPNEPVAIGGLTDLAEVYGYNPTPAHLSEDRQQLIMGTQANVWTEYIATPDQLEYMVFPRLCALSEVMWTSAENKDIADFEKRMDKHYLRLAKDEVNFRVPPPEGLNPVQIYSGKEAVVELTCPVPSAIIRYTTDGTEPTTNSQKYTRPIAVKLDQDVELKAATFLVDETKSYTVSSLLKRRELNPVKLKNPEKGLNFQYFDGPFRSFKEIGGTAQQTGKIDWLIIPPQTMSKQKGWIFDGYISIYQDGMYRFQLNSVCGSGLYINDELVIDNDGFSSDHVTSGLVELKAGFYPIHVKYFSTLYGPRIRLYYQRPGMDQFEVFPGEKYYR